MTELHKYTEYVIITAVMAFGPLRLKLDPSFDSAMPDDPEVIRMQDIISMEFGSTDTIARSGGA